MRSCFSDSWTSYISFSGSIWICFFIPYLVVFKYNSLRLKVIKDKPHKVGVYWIFNLILSPYCDNRYWKLISSTKNKTKKGIQCIDVSKVEVWYRILKKYEKTNTVRFFHFHVPRTELLLLFVKYGLEKVSKADKIIMYKKTDFIF